MRWATAAVLAASAAAFSFACAGRDDGKGKVGRAPGTTAADAAVEGVSADPSPVAAQPLSSLFVKGAPRLVGPVRDVVLGEPMAAVRARLGEPKLFTAVGLKRATWGGGWLGTRFRILGDRERVTSVQVTFGQRRGVREALVAAWGPGVPGRDFYVPGAAALYWFEPSQQLRVSYSEHTDPKLGDTKVLTYRRYLPFARLLAKELIGATDDQLAAKHPGHRGGALVLPPLEWSPDQTRIALIRRDGVIVGYRVTVETRYADVAQREYLAALEKRWGRATVRGARRVFSRLQGAWVTAVVDSGRIELEVMKRPSAPKR